MTGIRGRGKYHHGARIIGQGDELHRAGRQRRAIRRNPCGVCEHCVAIMGAATRRDGEECAASNTGVRNIREIIDSVH